MKAEMSQLEAFERVLVNNEFLNTAHGKIEYIACHRSDKNAEDKEAAY